jgi:hypothetical protein
MNATDRLPQAHAGAEKQRRTLKLERAYIRGDELVFDTEGGSERALRDGCFLLQIPSDMHIEPGIRFSREFFLPATIDGEPRSYRGFKARPDVYFDREHFQTEHVLIDGPGRAQHFPLEVVNLCDQMNALGITILKNILHRIGLSPDLWGRATGESVNNRGTHWFASSHYRTERDLLGCAPHKDTGFITVLYIDQPGLEADVDREWVSIDAVPGYFVINFGGALEILTRRSAMPIRAILHRVRRIAPQPGVPDRISFAAFLNPPAEGWLHEAFADGTIHPFQRVDEFLAEFNKVTWNDRHDEFGIK